MAAFWFRQRRMWREITPTVWLSPNQVLEQDLSMFVDEGRNKLPEKFIEDFVYVRDKLATQIKAQLLFSALVFMFLLLNYQNVGIGISILGFSLKYVPGVPEILLAISNGLACYTIILQANFYLIEHSIKCGINLEVPPELRNLYMTKYFPQSTFGRYQPFNLPHITPNKLHQMVTRTTVCVFLFLLVGTTIALTATNFYLLVYHLVLKPNFGMWSYLLFFVILLAGFFAFIYLILTRAKLPYKDFIINSELELLKQINPKLYDRRLGEIYGPLNSDRRRMRRYGYSVSK